MRIIPNSKFKIYKNISVDDDVTIVFASAANREAYFAKHLVAELNTQVIRRTGQLKFPLKKLNGVSLDECNYISFQNPAYDNVIYYCRISGKEYINNETAAISYGVDRWMTRMFDVSYHDMYIDREHLSVTDAAKIAANPYDPDVFEMRTAEPGLSFNKDFEKRNYTLGDAKDAVLICTELFKKTEPAGDPDKDFYDVIYISDINFSAFDSIDTGLDKSFYQYWQEIFSTFDTENPSGFYFRPNAIVGHSLILNTPYWPNRMSHPYYVIGFKKTDVLYEESKQYNLQTLLQYMNQAGVTDAILGIYSIPNTIIRHVIANGKYDTATPYAFESNVTGEVSVKSDYAGADPKLFQYPFSYMRVTTPDGQNKEYHYEEFKSVMDNEKKYKFVTGGELAETPKVFLLPDNYKYSSERFGNPLEAVVYDKFPTSPYTLDAWTAQMAAIASSNTMNYTAEGAQSLFFSSTFETGPLGYLRNIMKAIGSASPVLSKSNAEGTDGGSMTASYSADYSQAPRAAMDLASAHNQTRIQEIRNENFVASNNFLAGQTTENALYNNYTNTRPAFATDIYVRSSGDGTSAYNFVNFLDLLITHVRLTKEILIEYTKYFDNFGYASIRCGIPHVLGYTQGTDEPAWRTIDGDKCTYVKTRDAKVFSPDSETASAIKTMLDSGIRMLKGEDLS